MTNVALGPQTMAVRAFNNATDEPLSSMTRLSFTVLEEVRPHAIEDMESPALRMAGIVKEAFALAQDEASQLTPHTLQLDGMSGFKFRHWINNLLRLLGERAACAGASAAGAGAGGAGGSGAGDGGSSSGGSYCRYLEIGVYKGSTLCSAIYGNSMDAGRCVVGQGQASSHCSLF